MPTTTVQLEPIATDWGEVQITATIKTGNRKTNVSWHVDYPADIPLAEQQQIENLIRQFMKRQHDDLVRLFGQ
jgi:hypothetical protein